MINRENYRVVKEYLSHLKDEKQLDDQTVRNKWIVCKILLEYADEKPLYNLQGKKPTLPEYLLTNKSERTGMLLSVSYQLKILESVRAFYTWARIYKREIWAKVSESWVENLRVRRSVVNSSKEHKEHEFWKLEDVFKVARYEPKTLKEERMKAAICFLFLSGMRVTAFCSLPVDCVDIEGNKIEQKPSKGVITKNRKSATTALLPIPELLEVVKVWDKKIRNKNSVYWFSPFEVVCSNNGFEPAVISDNLLKSSEGRRSIFDSNLRELCHAANVPVLSAHKLRHGHIVYGMRNAKTPEELKVLSQNVMHANIGITDGIYGMLPDENIRRVISTFTQKEQQTNEKPIDSGQGLPDEFVKFAQMLYSQMKK